MERAVLARLLFHIPHPHQHIYAYTRGLSTKDNLATVYSLTDGVDSIITFLDIEKAFELANSKAIIHILAAPQLDGRLFTRHPTCAPFKMARPKEGYSVPSFSTS